MNKILYPAVFQPKRLGILFGFQIYQECVVEEIPLKKTYENIKDALGIFIEEQKYTKSYILPEASKPEDIKVDKGQFIALVEFDWGSYRKKREIGQ